MLGNSDVYCAVAVKDFAAARPFYEKTLGLEIDTQEPSGVLYKSGNTKIYIHQTQFAGTNQSTTAFWVVEDIESVVASLKSKGVKFEQYDIPDSTRDGDIYTLVTGRKAAWFTDPDGNIFAIDGKW